jgi:superfamily I DNA and/or RNA helicase
MKLYSINFKSIKVDTVDGFQGNECRIVIISLVWSGDRGIGFIGDVRRANVSLSRAKELAIVIGNFTTMRESSPNPWDDWFQYCRNLTPSGVISDREDITELWCPTK